MANINLNLPEEFRHVEYLDSLVLEIISYKVKFEPYLEELNVNVEINLPPFSDDQIINTMTEDDSVYELTVPFRRNWISPGELTSIPSPSDLYHSVIFALNSALQDFAKDDIDDAIESETNNEE